MRDVESTVMWGKRSRPIEDADRRVTDVAKARSRTMNRAVKLLAAKPRSVAELRTRLLEKAWTDGAIVDDVIEKLKEYGYLDDEQYAKSAAVSKLRQRPQGRRRLEQWMSQKKIDPETLDSALTSVFERCPEQDLIRTAIEKRVRLKGSPATLDEKKKFYDYLLRRGFGYDLIRDAMKEISDLDPGEDQ